MNQYDWPKQNTIAKWPFNGDLYDESPNEYHLDAYYSPNYVRGKFGQCAEFSGVEDCVRLLDPSDPLLRTTFSLDGWINTADDISIQTIISLAEYFDYSGNWGWILQVERGVIVFGSAEGTDWDLVYGKKPIADSMWHRVVLTAGSSIKIYIDGLLDKSSAGSSIGYPGDYPMALSVGVLYTYNYDYYDDSFIGKINHLEVLNSIKSPQEIQRDYAFQMGWL